MVRLGRGLRPQHDRDWMARLADPGKGNEELRRQLANQFRVFDARIPESPAPWPWIYGDAMNLPMPETPRAFTDADADPAAAFSSAVGGR